MKWTIGTKFNGGFIVVMLIAMGIISYFAINGLHTIANRAAMSYVRDTLPLFAVLKLIETNNAMEQANYEFLVGGPEVRIKELDLYNRLHGQFMNGIKTYEKEAAILSQSETKILLKNVGSYNDELQREIDALRTIHARENQRPTIELINDLIKNNQQEQAKELYFKKIREANTVDDALRTLAALQVEQSKYTTEESGRLAFYVTTEVIAVIIFTLMVGSLFFYFLSRSIVRPLHKLVQSIQAITASGDLDQKIDIKSHDETGELAMAFQNMTLYLKEMAEVAAKIAEGDLMQVVNVRSDKDMFGMAIDNMLKGLRKLVQQITELNKSEKVKKEFVAVVSHELRTPLTSVNGSLLLLLNGTAGPITEKMRNLLQIANTNTTRLIRLVNNILEIEKIETDQFKINFAPIDLIALIKSTVTKMQSIADKKQIKILFHSHDEVIINADDDKLKQVMENLLSNAIRFTSDEKTVTVNIEQRPDNFVRVSVIDQGVGIPTKFYYRIFQKFAQVDSSDTRSQDGTGLGLFISKAIIEKHGGSIHFTSSSAGSCFYFDVPKNTKA